MLLKSLMFRRCNIVSLGVRDRRRNSRFNYSGGILAPNCSFFNRDGDLGASRLAASFASHILTTCKITSKSLANMGLRDVTANHQSATVLRKYSTREEHLSSVKIIIGITS